MNPTDLTDYTDTAARRTTREMNEASTKLKDAVGMAQTKLGELADEARAFGDRRMHDLSRFGGYAVEKAKERPATSAVAILGIGIAVGALLTVALRRPTEHLTESALDGATRLRRKLHLS